MKKGISATIAALLASAGLMSAATNDLTSLIQKGLFEEEANHNLEAAMRAYQAAVDGIDKDRQLDATAVFRLGECWRKLGKTNEASLQYQRVLREFPEQTNLTKLCSEYLGGASATIPSEALADAKSQEIEAAYNSLKVKLALADSEFAMVTNMNAEDLGKYFTAVKPDAALLALKAARISAANALNEIIAKGFGPQNPEVVTRRGSAEEAFKNVSERMDALVWGLKKEAELLHTQADALRSLLNQPKLFAPDLATSTTPAPSAEDEEVRKIKEMIQNSPDLINGPGPENGWSPLNNAVNAGNMAAAELLLANGADPNGTSGDGTTPLGRAADLANKAMLELLLAKGADVNAADKNISGATPLHHAAAKGFKTVVEFLLAHKADVNARDPFGSTPLEVVARSGFRNVAELLLANQAEINARDKRGATPLSEAIQSDHPEIVQLLLANKADVNSADNQGETPLFVAIRKNQPEMVKLLLANKSDVNTTLQSGLTPLLLATSKPDIDLGLVKSLLQNGADTQACLATSPNGFDFYSRGRHALDFAFNTGRTNVLELLLASHADPNAASPGSSGSQSAITPLIWTELNSYANAEESFKILLDHGADPDLADYSGKTPLIYAVMRGNASLVQELLDHHADVNKPDSEGKPPLAYLPRDNQPAQPRMPVQPGLPSPVTSALRETKFGTDRQQSSAVIKALLLKAGANEDFQRLGRIFITQKGTGSIGTEIFHKDANSFNHYTLLELLAEAYKPVRPGPVGVGFGFGSGVVFFPDLAHVTINRLKSGGTKEEINVNLDEIVKSADCSKDSVLEWGDIVQIPQLDHLVNENWGGFSDEVRKNLANCLTRKVEIVVKGQTTNITLVSQIGRKEVADSFANRLAHLQTSQNLPVEPFSLSSFSLNEVVHGANVLLLSSDLTRVKVTRHGTPMTFNLEPGISSDLWLRDGDLIEIPERDTEVPATK